jgi:4-carboxymuconolactone decarboxylase
MSRIALLQNAELTGSARAVVAGIQSHGGKVPDLYRMIANAPDLLKAWTDLSWPLRNSQLTSRGLREILIMRTAHLTQAGYEWAHHWDLALNAGVTVEKLKALPAWRTSMEFDTIERAALDFSDALILTGEVPDAIFNTLSRHLDSGQLVHIAMTICFYVCVARMASAFALQLEPNYADRPAMPNKEGLL